MRHRPEQPGLTNRCTSGSNSWRVRMRLFALALNFRLGCTTDCITDCHSQNGSKNGATHFPRPKSKGSPGQTSADYAGIREPMLFFVDDHITFRSTKAPSVNSATRLQRVRCAAVLQVPYNDRPASRPVRVKNAAGPAPRKPVSDDPSHEAHDRTGRPPLCRGLILSSLGHALYGISAKLCVLLPDVIL